MTKYFYTDPLAAAWMQKHFGMRFEFGELHNPEFAIRHRIYRDEPMTVYLHSDSLPLLEPRGRDLLFKEAEYQALDDIRFAENPNDPDGFHKNLNARFIERGYRIVLRDGKPFFWPESEEV